MFTGPSIFSLDCGNLGCRTRCFTSYVACALFHCTFTLLFRLSFPSLFRFTSQEEKVARSEGEGDLGGRSARVKAKKGLGPGKEKGAFFLLLVGVGPEPHQRVFLAKVIALRTC